MTYGGTLTTEAVIISKEGAGVSASVTEDMHTAWSLEAEQYICSICKYDFVMNVATLTPNTAQLLGIVVSNYVAINAIQYDVTEYDSILESQNKVSLLKQFYNEAVNALLDKSVQDYVK